jgi:four helix bundle protein
MTFDEQKGLEGLFVWQKAQDFALEICKNIIIKMPEAEKYALTSQLRRSSQSIAANIAEGYGRYYYQEGIRFTYIAKGSLEETYSHLSFALRMSYISKEDFELLKEKIEELRRMTNGFINYLKKSKKGISEPGAAYFTIPHVDSSDASDIDTGR